MDISFDYQGQEYRVDFERITNKQFILIEKYLGLNMDTLVSGLQSSSMTAMTAIVWAGVQKHYPAMRLDQIEFEPKQLMESLKVYDDDGAELSQEQTLQLATTSGVPTADDGTPIETPLATDSMHDAVGDVRPKADQAVNVISYGASI